MIVPSLPIINSAGYPITPNFLANLELGSTETGNLYFLLLIYGLTCLRTFGLLTFMARTFSPVSLKFVFN